jgi:hypothetical protein
MADDDVAHDPVRADGVKAQGMVVKAATPAKQGG